MPKPLPEVVLRNLCADDDPMIAALNERPEILRRIGLGSYASQRCGDVLRVIIYQSEFAGIVGVVRSLAYDGKDVELLCAITKNSEGKGIASAACTQILRVGDLYGSPARVLACIEPSNGDGQLLATRLGFANIGARPSGDQIWEYRQN